jgi:hypothetical protein
VSAFGGKLLQSDVGWAEPCCSCLSEQHITVLSTYSDPWWQNKLVAKLVDLPYLAACMYRFAQLFFSTVAAVGQQVWVASWCLLLRHNKLLGAAV